MQGVMEVGKYPQIMYRLETVKQTARHPAEGRFVYDTVGKLQIHGITRTIYMIVEVRRQETEIRIAGETHLRMSGFGISPPSRFFLIRVKDTVTMQFQLVGRQVSQ
jgi:polyisoprenoid-binding protein YceI